MKFLNTYRLVCFGILPFTCGIALSIGLMGITSAAPTPKDAKDSAYFFPTRVGDKLVYTIRGGKEPDREEIIIVNSVEDKDSGKVIGSLIKLENGERSPWYDMFVRDDGLYMYSPPGSSNSTLSMCYLKVPYKLGNRWNLPSPPNEGGKWIRVVRGKERLKVPAGEFEAIQVNNEEVVFANKYRVITQRWYARGLGEVKSIGGERVRELKSYQPA